jgi:hypothetical protein
LGGARQPAQADARPGVELAVAASDAAAPALQPKPGRAGGAVLLDSEGQIVDALFDSDGDHIISTTSVEPYGGYLWIGSLSAPVIGRLPYPDR